MIEWYLKVVRDNYANFNGRARRSEYWFYSLATFLINIVLSILDWIIGLEIDIFSTVYGIAVLVPGLAVTVRRLHDTNKSGWYFLLVLLPVIGWIWLLVLLCTEGTYGPNDYGSDPKNPYHDLDEIGKPQY
nr:DUF805 domain-containing protein [uncultured Flavobacterium sp.]